MNTRNIFTIDISKDNNVTKSVKKYKMNIKYGK